MNKRIDGASISDGPGFEPATIKILDMATLVLLLSSKEEEVIIASLHSIDKNCSKDCKSLVKLFNLNVVDKIMTDLVKSEVLFIKRFSWKIVAELCQLDKALEQISSFVDEILTIFCETADEFLLEYSSNILQHIMNDPKICVLVQSQPEFLKRVVELVNSTKDFDVYSNVMEMLIKITSDPDGLKIISDQKAINIPTIFETIGSVYPTIQKQSLKFFANFAYSTNEYLLKDEFLNGLFSHLEDSSFHEFYPDLLKILRTLVRNNTIGEKILRDGNLDKILNFLKNNPNQKSNSIGVLAELSNLDDAREALYEKGFPKILLETLQDGISKECCDGISFMFNSSSALTEFTSDSSLIQKLISTIKNDNQDNIIRTAASNTLSTLLYSSKKACLDFLKTDGNLVIANLLSKNVGGEVPHNLLVSLINSLIHLAKHPEVKHKIIDELMSQSILCAFKNSIISTTLAILMVKCISSFILTNEDFQKQALESGLNSIIFTRLKNNSVALKTALNNFIILTAPQSLFSEEYINKGVLEYLIKNESKFQIICVNWSMTIESILRSNLSIKFAHSNKLDFYDAIQDGFYVSRKPFNDFKVLRTILNEDCSPRFPVFFIHFNNEISEILEKSKSSTGSCSELCYSKKPLDVDLPEYVSRIQEKFNEISSDSNSKMEIFASIEKKYKIIAELVSEEMSSATSDVTSCTKHGVDFHLNELKISLNCNIIPIGMVKLGGFFERAVLFKALSDHFGLTSTLNLSFNNKGAWNDVAIPVKDPSIKFPHFTIDLMKNPGELYPIRSKKSIEYKNKSFWK